MGWNITQNVSTTNATETFIMHNSRDASPLSNDAITIQRQYKRLWKLISFQIVKKKIYIYVTLYHYNENLLYCELVKNNREWITSKVSKYTLDIQIDGSVDKTSLRPVI